MLRFPIATAIPIPIPTAIRNGLALHPFIFLLMPRRTGRERARPEPFRVAWPEAVVLWVNYHLAPPAVLHTWF
jgi:hypothetical protein